VPATEVRAFANPELAPVTQLRGVKQSCIACPAAPTSERLDLIGVPRRAARLGNLDRPRGWALGDACRPDSNPFDDVSALVILGVEGRWAPAASTALAQRLPDRQRAGEHLEPTAGHHVVAEQTDQVEHNELYGCGPGGRRGSDATAHRGNQLGRDGVCLAVARATRCLRISPSRIPKRGPQC